METSVGRQGDVQKDRKNAACKTHPRIDSIDINQKGEQSMSFVLLMVAQHGDKTGCVPSTK